MQYGPCKGIMRGFSLHVKMRCHHICFTQMAINGHSPGRTAQSVEHLAQESEAPRGPGFDTRFGHTLSFRLLLIQEGQLSVTGVSVCT